MQIALHATMGLSTWLSVNLGVPTMRLVPPIPHSFRGSSISEVPIQGMGSLAMLRSKAPRLENIVILADSQDFVKFISP